MAAEHEHFWSPWAPEDRTHKYRYCLHPECTEVEHREVLA